MNMTLEQVIEAIKVLTPQELYQLRDKLDETLASQDISVKEDAFEQALLASGLIQKIRTPSPQSSLTSRKLIETKGKLASEIIIEERR